MRLSSASIATAIVLSVAVAQKTPSPWTSSSSGYNEWSAGSVSCVFRYTMPTGTNLPRTVAINTSPTPTPDSDNDEETNATSGGSDDVDKSDPEAATASDEPDSVASNSSSEGSLAPSSTPRSTPTKAPTSTSTPTPRPPATTAPSESASDHTADTSDASPSLQNATDATTPSTTTNTTASPPSTGSNDGRRLLEDAGESGGTTGNAGNTTAGTAGNTTVDSPSDAALEASDTSQLTGPSPATTATNTSASTTKIKTPSSSSTDANTTTTAPKATTTDTGTKSTNATLEATTIEFSCDSTFYEAWSKMGLTCGGTELDVVAAAASTECLIYSGTSSGTAISDLATCMSVCRFPACHDGTWDYTASDGLDSEIYANLDFISLMNVAGNEASASVADAVQQPFSNLTFATTTECDYTSDNSFSACQCAGMMGTPSTSSGTSKSSAAHYSVPRNKGLGDANHWPDGKKKSSVDKVGIVSTTIGSSAATVSVVAGGIMSVASGVVGGASASVASGVSAAASVGITMAAVDLCQFSIMLNQMNVDARPRFMEDMGKKMAPASFTFLPFGKLNTSSDDDTTRRLSTSSSSAASDATANVQGMEKYAHLIGVDPGMLFYVAVAGIACMVALLFGMYMLAMGACYFLVSDFPTFSLKWLDKAIGALMMILILSQYVVGATAMYQICYCIDRDSLDVSFGLAILTLLCLAFGTILYGVIVIKNNEDELRDLGTKDHFDKKFHNRYGPLYDEHSFEGRFFFAPKLLLALLCGMTTGMVWLVGLWQIVVLIALHIAFLLYLEIKQPYPTAFVQKTSSFVIIVKISALFLSFFLLSSATSFTKSIPDDLREGVAFAIVGLQVLVLMCLMIRQVYIFYRTWKLKRDGASHEDKTVTVQTTNGREASEAFFAIGGSEPQYYGNASQHRGGSPTLLGGDVTPKVHESRQYMHETPASGYANQPPLRGLRPQRTHTSVRHRTDEVDL